MTPKQRAMIEAATASVMRRAMSQIEEAVIYGSSAATITASADADPLTLERITDMIASLPKPETWVVSRMFPPDCALVARTPDENFTCFNDETWDRFRRELPLSEKPGWAANPMYEIRPLFLDPDPLDEPSRADRRDQQRKRVFDALLGTLQASVSLAEVRRAWWRRLTP